MSDQAGDLIIKPVTPDRWHDVLELAVGAFVLFGVLLIADGLGFL